MRSSFGSKLKRILIILLILGLYISVGGFAIPREINAIDDVVFSPNGTKLAYIEFISTKYTPYEGRSLNIIRLSDMKIIHKLDITDQFNIEQLRWKNDSSKIGWVEYLVGWFGSSDLILHTWDLSTGELYISPPLSVNSQFVWDFDVGQFIVTYPPVWEYNETRQLVPVIPDSRIIVFDLFFNVITNYTISGVTSVNPIGFLPENNLLLFGPRDGSLLIVSREGVLIANNTPAYEPPLENNRYYFKSSSNVNFTPDNSMIVILYKDQVIIFDVFTVEEISFRRSGLWVSKAKLTSDSLVYTDGSKIIRYDLNDQSTEVITERRTDILNFDASSDGHVVVIFTSKRIELYDMQSGLEKHFLESYIKNLVYGIILYLFASLIVILGIIFHSRIDLWLFRQHESNSILVSNALNFLIFFITLPIFFLGLTSDLSFIPSHLLLMFQTNLFRYKLIHSKLKIGESPVGMFLLKYSFLAFVGLILGLLIHFAFYPIILIG